MKTVFLLLISFSLFAVEPQLSSNNMGWIFLEGTINHQVATDYLAKHDVTPYEYEEGKALTGLIVENWKELKSGSPSMTITDFYNTYVLILLDIDEETKKETWYAGDFHNSSFLIRTAGYLKNGLNTKDAYFEFKRDSLGDHLSSTVAQVRSAHCYFLVFCSYPMMFYLSMGKSDEVEVQDSTRAIGESRWVFEKTSKGQYVGDWLVEGKKYQRAYNPNKDTYMLGEDGVVAELFKTGNFTPTMWEWGSNLSLKGWDVVD